MTSSAPWSVKGIDPNAREAAKDQARRAGLTLGEWLTRRIQEETAEGEAGEAAKGPLSRALDRLTSRIEIAEQRSTLAVTGIDQSVRGVLARLENTERDQVSLGARFEGALQDVGEVQSQLVERLIRLEDQTTDSRSLEAVKGLEGQVARLANQVYDTEGRQRETNADLRRDLGALASRIEGGEGGAGVADRIDQAEARTTAALRSLESSIAQLDRRLETAESRIEGDEGGSLDRRLSEIAANLTSGLDAARAEMADQLRESADGQFERMERALRDMDAHVQAAERRSSEAIEQIGREVLRVAEALNRKVAGSEQRAAGAIEQVGGEVARVVGSMDVRLSRTESTQAIALDKLGADLTRVTERLTERIGVAERRSAQMIDDVGEQISRVTERMNQRYERSATDLAERIRQSEERTVRLLEEARERQDTRQRKVEPAPAPQAAAGADPFAAPPFPEGPGVALAAANPPQYVIYPDVAPFGQAIAPADMAAPGFSPVIEDFRAEDIEAASGFAAPATPQSEADFVDETPSPIDFSSPAFDPPADERLVFGEPATDDFEPVDVSYVEDLSSHPPPAAGPSTPLTPRELIEQARAAARNAQAERAAGGRRSEGRAAAGGFSGSPYATRRRRGDRRGTLLAASLVIALVFTVGAGVIVAAGGGSNLINGVTNRVAVVFGGAPAVPEAEQGPADDLRLAVALNPEPILPGDPLAVLPPLPVAASAGPDAEEQFLQGKAKVDAKNNSGTEQVRRAANLGHAPAQVYLATLYQKGEGGLAKDLIQARRWFERAAAGGNRKAMHETGVMQHFGQGGPVNLVSAAEWFKRAAEAGSTDSQFNLGALYETGSGVAVNLAESYKWYLLAARDPDEGKGTEARNNADRVKSQLSLEEKAAAERFAQGFIPTGPSSAPRTAAGPDYLGLQRSLARLGYYRGAQNGRATEELRTAILSYQRDQGLSATGVLDPTTADRLKATAR